VSPSTISGDVSKLCRVTSQEQESAESADRDIPDTEVIVKPAPSPVFVDSTGRRRRLLRRLSYAFGAVCVLYGGLVSVTLSAGPVSTSAILPLPDLGAVAVTPSPTPLPTFGPPKARAVIEALPRRDLAAAGTNRFVANRRASTPSPRATSTSATPKPSVTTSRPVESTPTPTPSATPSATGSATPSASPSTGPTKTKQPPPSPPTSGTDDDADSAGDRDASALPAPPTEIPTTDTADTTPSPTPQPSAAETPA
jgi:hypothetical protein